MMMTMTMMVMMMTMMMMMTKHCACHGKLFPALQLHYKLATSDSESSSEKLFPVLHLHYKLAISHSKSEAPSLQNERCVRDFLLKSRVKVSKASASCETSSKSEAPSLQITTSPHFGALDTHSRRRGSHHTFERSTRTILAEGHPRPLKIRRALDTHDPPRGSPAPTQNSHFTTRLSARQARSLQRVTPGQSRSTFHHTFGRSTRTILAEGHAS